MSSSAATFDQQFISFAKFADPNADGKTITLTKSDRWLRQANVLDDDNITMTDTGIAFNKFKCSTINYQDFIRYLHVLCTEKQLNYEMIKEKLTECGAPGTKDKKGEKTEMK